MKYLKTFKYSTSGTGDGNIEQTDKKLTYTDGEDLGEHAAVIGFAQTEVEDFLRSFPDVHRSNRAR